MVSDNGKHNGRNSVSITVKHNGRNMVSNNGKHNGRNTVSITVKHNGKTWFQIMKNIMEETRFLLL